MPAVIAVRFAYATRDLWFNPTNSGALEGDHVICSTERGTEIGLATSNAKEVTNAELYSMIGSATLKPILRVATDDDLARAEVLAQKGEEAFPAFRELVAQTDLEMKPVGVEYLFGGEKVVCYFAAEERVDFRQLVRDLSKELHERIDMRQIGVREEAAFVGGFGHCGQELCCARIGLSFEPVSIRMAKEQDLPLTSNKISGACGRLMCCLRYEFEAYRDFKGRAPKRNALIDTPLGKAKVVEYDMPKEQLALRLENGKVVRVPLGEMVASQTAVKKSEELHCPCRPDTVVRASLDKLSSPDVQMALAELDRKMGVLPEETYNEDDIFVEQKPRRRRARKSAGAAGGTQGQAESVEQQAAKQAAQPTRRTRRRGANKPAEAATDAKVAVPGVQTSEGGQAEKKPRRRRRKRASAADGAVESRITAESPVASAGEAQPKDKTSTQPSRRRRHHHQASDVSATRGEPRRKTHAGQAQQGYKPQHAKQEQTAQTQQGYKPQHAKQEQAGTSQKPKRRPGDKGGQAVAQQGQRNQQGLQSAPRQEGEPRRRRRRRGNRNKPAADE